MPDYGFPGTLANLPRPGEPDRVAVAEERWFERLASSPALAARARAVAADPGGGAPVAPFFGPSPPLPRKLLGAPQFSLPLLHERAHRPRPAPRAALPQARS